MRLLVRLLLRLFPAGFRRAFGAAMLATFDDQWREAAGPSLAWRTIAGLIRSACLLRLSTRPIQAPARKGDNLMKTFGHDLRFALRQLRKAPGFAVIAVLVLALGVGANTAVFSVVDAVLLRPLPYSEADRLVSVVETHKGATADEVTLTSDFLDWRAQNHVFTAIAGFTDFTRTLTGLEEPLQLRTVKASAGLLTILKVQPFLGRNFLTSEDAKGHDAVAILSYGLWQRSFGGNRDVLGRSITLDDRPLTVIGVLPLDFRFPNGTIDLMTPLGKNEETELKRGNEMTIIRNVIARLKPGVSLPQARADMEVIESHLPRPFTGVQLSVRVLGLQEWLVGNVRATLLTLLCAVGFLLLMACANVANLLLSRAVSRQREMAVRSALGASRSRIAGQLLVESMVLGALGCAGGLALAFWTRGLLLSLVATSGPGIEALPMDFRVLAFAAIAAVASAIVFGIGPALSGAEAPIAASLSSDSRSLTGGARRQFWLNTLATAQLAIAIVLLTVGGLMLQSFWKMRYRDLGFQPDRLLMAKLKLSPARYPSGPKQIAFLDQVVEAARNLPGAHDAAIGSLPPGGGHATNGFGIEGRAFTSGRFPVARQCSVSAAYFRVLGIPVLRGRTMAESDAAGATPIALVSETFARRIFPGEDALGKRIRMTAKEPYLTIVGEVGDVKTAGLAAEPEPVIYFPYRQAGSSGDPAVLVVRTALDPVALGPELRKRVAQLDPMQPVASIQTMDQHLTDSVSRPRLATILLSCFAVLGLLLAGVGLYGVMSFLVRWRFREIGIRMAIGAQPADVMRMVLTRSLRVILAGAAVGIGCALWLSRLMQGLLYGVSPADPLTFGGAVVFLSVVGLAASYIPARQASRIDPMASLRAE
jgi:putative ABC transport system permease protein